MKKVNEKLSKEKMKLIFEDESKNIFDDFYSIKAIVFFSLLIGLIIFSIGDKGEQKDLLILIIGLLVFGLILWNVLRNQIYGNNLLKVKTNLSKKQNQDFIIEIAKMLHWELRLETGNQFRFIEKDVYRFMDYETTILNFENEILFNYRSVRKGTNLKSVFSGKVNEKQMIDFAAKIHELKKENSS